jgi:sugar-specific transcriptional regulator TrmB
MEDILQKIGLTENETQVYISLLKAGNKTAAEIARDLSLDKSSTYRACENLTKLGLIISSPKLRGTTYLAQNPNALHEVYQRQMKKFESLGSQLNETISELQKTARGDSRNVQLRTEYGLEAVRKVMVESLNNKDKIIREWQQTGKNYYRNKDQVAYILDFAAKRIKAGIQIRQLESDQSFKDDGYKGIMATDKKLLKEIRMMPGGFNDKNTLRIWEDTVNIISFDDNDDFVVVTIKDKYIALLIRNLFDFVWNKSEAFQG